MCWMLPILEMTDANLVSTNVSEDDYPEWTAGETIAQNAFRISTVTHTIYQAQRETTGEDPDDPANIYNADTNVSGAWLRVSATNRWKSLWQSPSQSRITQKTIGPVGDSTTADSTTPTADATYYPEDIYYEFTAPLEFIDAIILEGVASTAVSLVIYDGAGEIVDERSATLIDYAGMEALALFTGPIPYRNRITFYGVPMYPGFRLGVRIAGPGASVGQIILGRYRQLGVSVAGTEPGLDDYSTIEFDETFGDPRIVRRGNARRVEFNFYTPLGEERALMDYIASQFGRPVVVAAEPDNEARGTFVIGIMDSRRQGFSIPLVSAGVNFCRLAIRGFQ